MVSTGAVTALCSTLLGSLLPQVFNYMKSLRGLNKVFFHRKNLIIEVHYLLHVVIIIQVKGLLIMKKRKYILNVGTIICLSISGIFAHCRIWFIVD